MKKSKFGLVDLGENWADWVLDMKNLVSDLPDKEKGVCLSIYAVDVNKDQTSIGHFLSGKESILLAEGLHEFLCKNLELLPMFFNVWKYACEELKPEDERTVLLSANQSLEKEIKEIDIYLSKNENR